MRKSVSQMFEEKQERITSRIAIKDRSIAYFNSLNAAISRCPTGTLEEIIKWRDDFYKEWETWYSNLLIEIEKEKNHQKPDVITRYVKDDIRLKKEDIPF